MGASPALRRTSIHRVLVFLVEDAEHTERCRAIIIDHQGIVLGRIDLTDVLIDV